jgi:hypothetical protein
MNTFQIGLSAWIIQDGNYDDLSVNQELNFALEFHPYSLSPASDETAKLDLVGPALYSVHGRIEFTHPRTWVADFGLKAYQDSSLPEELQSARWIKGNVYLGVDPFPYSERLKDLPGIPPLTYKWLLRKIKLETTPWIKTEKLSFRDQAKVSFREITKTDAWNDDSGHGHYILECDCLGSI